MANCCECLVEFYGSKSECKAFITKHFGQDGGGDPCFDLRWCQNETHPIGFSLRYSVNRHYRDRYVAMVRFWTKWGPPTAWFEAVLQERSSGYAVMNWWERNHQFCGEMDIQEETREIRRWDSEDYQGWRGG